MYKSMIFSTRVWSANTQTNANPSTIRRACCAPHIAGCQTILMALVFLRCGAATENYYSIAVVWWTRRIQRRFDKVHHLWSARDVTRWCCVDEHSDKMCQFCMYFTTRNTHLLFVLVIMRDFIARTLTKNNVIFSCVCALSWLRGMIIDDVRHWAVCVWHATADRSQAPRHCNRNSEQVYPLVHSPKVNRLRINCTTHTCIQPHMSWHILDGSITSAGYFCHKNEVITPTKTSVLVWSVHRFN